VVLAVVAMQAVDSASAQQSTVQPTQSDQVNPKDEVRPQANRVETPSTTHVDARAQRHTAQHFKASELIGLNVRGKSGDKEIGEIKDLAIGQDGKIIYAAVSFGGFLGVGEKLFAVPFESIDIVREAGNKDNLYARMDIAEETLKSKAGFDNNNWPDRPDMSFMPQAARTARQTDRTDRSAPTGRQPYVPR
jgi:hypothetical protein